VKIQIENNSMIPARMIERIVNASSLPSERVLLVVGTDSMAGNRNDLLGMCIPRLALDTVGNCLRTEGRRSLPWDAGVALSYKACEHYDSYPAFFAQLLGHELGHAALCLTDPILHIYSTFIYYNWAGKYEKIYRNRFPAERRFEQYGIAVAQDVYSREQLDREVRELLTKDRKDKDILSDLLGLSGCMDLKGLKEELVLFASQRKGLLIQKWRKRLGEAARMNVASVTRVVPSIELLFL
jgi:hypothetical protein